MQGLLTKFSRPTLRQAAEDYVAIREILEIYGGETNHLITCTGSEVEASLLRNVGHAARLTGYRTDRRFSSTRSLQVDSVARMEDVEPLKLRKNSKEGSFGLGFARERKPSVSRQKGNIGPGKPQSFSRPSQGFAPGGINKSESSQGKTQKARAPPRPKGNDVWSQRWQPVTSVDRLQPRQEARKGMRFDGPQKTFRKPRPFNNSDNRSGEKQHEVGSGFGDFEDDVSLGVSGKSTEQSKKSWGNRFKGKNVSNKGFWDAKKRLENEERAESFKFKKDKKANVPRQPVVHVPKVVSIPAEISLVKFAKLIESNVSDVERLLTEIGEAPKSLEDTINPESAELVAMELGKTIHVTGISKVLEANTEMLPRPAVITVMGHVDHGKTSLLDALRSTSVAAREAGGITQHVGAFEVKMPESGKSLTFLDTPGHAAFTAMRARGAAITDIVVLVVAADDGVMPQTKEALAHATASGCPIVVAITKCDLDGANPGRVKAQLGELGMELEDFGGNVQVVELAAPKGIGLKDLENALLLESEILELKAPQLARATATVVESRVDKGQGPVAMVIVTGGKLEQGQSVVVGDQWGKIRMLKDSSGSQIVKDGATPGRPVEVIGLKGTPNAGDELLVVANDERAQKISRSRSIRTQQIKNTSQVSNIEKSDSSDTEEVSGPTTIPVVIKADVQGSAEAVRDSISSLSNEHVIINVIHTGVGPITSSDIALAIPFGGHVIGFNVKAASDAEAIAKQHSVGIHSRRIIYELIEDVENMIQGAVPKPLEEVSIGNAQVLALFKIPGKRGKPDRVIAGCRVLDGVIKSTMKIRVMRSGEIVFEAPVESLRRHKLDVETVGKGTECGVGVQGFQDFMVGDSLSCIDLQ